MSALVLASVMADLAAAVQAVLASGRVAHSRPAEGVREGDAVVGYPQEPIDLTVTFRRGLDRLTVPVYVLCGMPQDATTQTAISGWLASGSVVEAIQGYAGTWSSVFVTAQIEEFTPIGGSPLVALRFDCDIVS